MYGLCRETGIMRQLCFEIDWLKDTYLRQYEVDFIIRILIGSHL